MVRALSDSGGYANPTASGGVNWSTKYGTLLPSNWRVVHGFGVACAQRAGGEGRSRRTGGLLKSFYVELGPVVRIAFAEQSPGDEPRFRLGVALGYQDAIALAQLLDEMLKPFKEQISPSVAPQSTVSANGA
jgi:hypothetical protein